MHRILLALCFIAGPSLALAQNGPNVVFGTVSARSISATTGLSVSAAATPPSFARTASSGNSLVGLSLANPAASATGNGICIDLAPNNVGAGARSAQICATDTNSGNTAALVFSTANGAAPAEVGRFSASGDFLMGGSGTANVVVDASRLVRLRPYTVATLPSCTSTINTVMALVTDASNPTYNGSLTGGGSVRVPVYCNGSAWTAH